MSVIYHAHHTAFSTQIFPVENNTNKLLNLLDCWAMFEINIVILLEIHLLRCYDLIIMVDINLPKEIFSR